MFSCRQHAILKAERLCGKVKLAFRLEVAFILEADYILSTSYCIKGTRVVFYGVPLNRARLISHSCIVYRRRIRHRSPSSVPARLTRKDVIMASPHPPQSLSHQKLTYGICCLTNSAAACASEPYPKCPVPLLELPPALAPPPAPSPQTVSPVAQNVLNAPCFNPAGCCAPNGSPKVTTAPTFAWTSAVSPAIALCATIPPCEYPVSASLVSGQDCTVLPTAEIIACDPSPLPVLSCVMPAALAA